MTEEEARLILDVRISRFDHAQDVNEALEIAKQSLEEIQKYREIGTVEECRAAVKKLGTKIDKPKCEDCLFLEDKERGRKGAVIGTCKLKYQNGRRYGKTAGCRFF